MANRSLPRAAFLLGTLSGLIMLVALLLTAPVTTHAATLGAMSPAASLQQTFTWVTGTVLFSDRSLCHYNSAFFNTKTFPVIEQVDDSGNVVGATTPPAGATALGLYEIDVQQPPATVNLRVRCEGTVYQRALTADELARGLADLVLPNKKPVANPIVARFNGLSVKAVPAGSTVQASVAAADPDGNPLHYRWGASAGAAADVDAPQTTWTLPASRGLHFLYVLVFDGNGGYEEKQLALSTDGGTAPVVGSERVYLPLIINRITTAGPYLAAAMAPAASVPSDHTPANDHFLTFSALKWPDQQPADGVIGPLDTRVSACQYYRDLGVIGGCTADGHPTGAQLTFSAWKAYWGFGAAGNNEAKAKYANLADLNLQRDMHTLSRPNVPRPNGGTGTDVASYVCNYPNMPADPTLGNVLHDRNMVACVAFEYSVTKSPTSTLYFNGGLPFTKFLTFGPTGDLLMSVNLDGRGEKFIPGACVACHGGSGYSGQYGLLPSAAPNLGAQFIPYDLDNYAFSNQPGYTRPEQEAQLRRLNEFVLDTGAYTPTIELIHGWYPTPTSGHHGAFIPPAWTDTITDTQLYEAVIKPQCRMCHLVLDPGKQFDTPANFAGWTYYVGSRVCGVGIIPRYFTTMPNAKQTFDRFWNSIGGPPGVDEPALLLAYLKSQDPTITTCNLPSWLP